MVLFMVVFVIVFLVIFVVVFVIVVNVVIVVVIAVVVVIIIIINIIICPSLEKYLMTWTTPKECRGRHNHKNTLTHKQRTLQPNYRLKRPRCQSSEHFVTLPTKYMCI